MILALDLGTHTGVAKGCAGERPTLATWVMPAGGGANVGAFGAAFDQRLEAELDGVRTVIFEEPYISQFPNQVRRAYGMAFMIETKCAQRGIECFGVVTVSLKKSFTGSGRAQKVDMIRMAQRRGFSPANDHEADAVACWLHAVANHHPEFAHLYDPIFAGGRS